MLCLVSQSNDPYFNLATEEYMLKNSNDELFMLYVNNPSVVAGKHQNILSEINMPWILENNFFLARRITGGGTVYHDHGNLNFSFIFYCPNIEKIRYERFTLPIVQALNSLGIKAKFSGRNDLVIESYKVSGNAMHIYKNRVLSHGTLLYKSDLHNLSSALKNHPERYIDKSIKSIHSHVANISDYLFPPLSMDEFVTRVFGETCNHLVSPRTYTLNPSDTNEIEKLASEKFAAWDWIYGYSPKYIFENEIEFNGQSVHFQLNVEKGLIKNYDLKEDKNPDLQFKKIFDSLINVRHDYLALFEHFSEFKPADMKSHASVEEFCWHFF